MLLIVLVSYKYIYIIIDIYKYLRKINKMKMFNKLLKQYLSENNEDLGNLEPNLIDEPLDSELSDESDEQEFRLKGGTADKMTEEEIADALGEELSDVNRILDKGQKVEMEHTNDKKIARQIAMDHLMKVESLDYYDELEKMEEKIKARKQERKVGKKKDE